MNRCIGALQGLALAVPCYPANAANAANAATTGDVATAATLATTATNQPKDRDFVATVASRHGMAPLLVLPACTTMQARATVRHGASHTIEVAGNLPDSEVFSRPEFSNAALRRVYGFGAGSAYPQGRQHGYFHVTIPSPTQWPSQPKGGFQSQVGAETMTTSPVASRCAAPVSQAAPANTTPTSASTEAQAFALLQAVTSTNLAGFYLRRDNVAQARRKLRQALQALSALEVAHA